MNKGFDLQKYYTEKNLMYMAIIELTTTCNMNCIHYFFNTKTNYGLKTSEVFELLNELRELGVYKLQFTGGEIFLRKDIMDIIKQEKEKYFKVDL